MDTAAPDIGAYIREKQELVDRFLASRFCLPAAPALLSDAVAYSLNAGGKRIRPVLSLASYEACGHDPEEIVPYAAALECIHTYSLIHDDLPAMDNDDLRRGKPTNHKVFGEGMAILAGDALLTEAFYMLASNGSDGNRPPDTAVLRVIREIAMASGMHGMVGGQAQDLLSENTGADPETLAFIHSHKTAALITVAVRTGGILAGCDDDALLGLTRYGESVGFAFQVVDDILDVSGETEVLGKTAGSDERKKKMTYPGLFGIETSVRKAEALVGEAVDALLPFGERAEPLREIARFLLRRKN